MATTVGPLGLHHVTAVASDPQRNADFYLEVLGLRLIKQTLNFDAPDTYHLYYGDDVGTVLTSPCVDMLARPGDPRGQVAAGIVHHVAWRAPHDEARLAWRREIIDLGLPVTAVLDRGYLHSIYFREPDGLPFEIATAKPGFTIDESPEALGAELRLPPRLEPRRGEILPRLLPLTLPDRGEEAK
jgi:glyoxalase family protein